MRQTATTCALGAWMGFSGTSGAILFAASFDPVAFDHFATLAGSLGMEGGFPVLSASEALCFSALLFGVAASLFMAISSFQIGTRAADRSAESLACAALVALGVFAGFAWLAEAPVASLFGSGIGFVTAILASFAALGFDRLTAVYDENDDEAFEAALRSVRASYAEEDERRGSAER